MSDFAVLATLEQKPSLRHDMSFIPSRYLRWVGHLIASERCRSTAGDGPAPGDRLSTDHGSCMNHVQFSPKTKQCRTREFFRSLPKKSFVFRSLRLNKRRTTEDVGCVGMVN